MSLLNSDVLYALQRKHLYLSDDGHSIRGQWEFARALEAAWMQALASAELPEPALTKQYNLHKAVRYMDKNSIGDCDASWVDAGVYFTADQLRQAYAQGAASQLSAEPVGFIDRYGEIFAEAEQMLSTDTPLFTLKEPK